MKALFSIMLIVSLSLNISAQWIPKPSGTTNQIRSVHFVDNNTGWISGLDGLIKKTYDGGETWVNTGYHGASTNRWYDIFAISTNDVYACGSTFNVDRWQTNYGLTVNGGTSWIFQSSWGSANGSVKQVFFLNENLGWKVGFQSPSGRLWRTTAGIDGWSDYWSLAHNPYSVYFIDENNGWISCQDGFVLKSTDGGENWTDIETGFTESLRSIYFISSSLGWAVGYASDIGVIIKTTDGGSTWYQVEHPLTLSLHSIQFVNENIGWACGSKFQNSEERGVILYTNDGGENWSEQYVSEQLSSLFSLFFIDGLTGWAVGYDGLIVKTINAGGTSFEGIAESSDKYFKSYSYPNPSSTTTTIKYSIKQPEKVTITLYNYLGKQVKFIQEEQSTGNQNIKWDIEDLASGMYYYSLVAGEYMSSGKIVVCR